MSTQEAATTERLEEVGKGLDAVAADMKTLRAGIGVVDEKLRQMDAQLTSPATVRRATLRQVWNRLMDAGQYEAAFEVRKMLDSVVDDLSVGSSLGGGHEA